MSDGGKGSARRKGDDQDAFAKGYDLIWGDKKKQPKPELPKKEVPCYLMGSHQCSRNCVCSTTKE